MYPMRLAGTMNEYSANAIPQLKSTTNGNESLLNQGVFCKCRWLYQANVMNTFEQVSSKNVYNPFIIHIIIYL